MQVDGEPWAQARGRITVTQHARHGRMLHRAEGATGRVAHDVHSLLEWGRDEHVIDREQQQALLRELSRRTEHAKLSLQARRSSRSWSDLTRGSTRDAYS